MMKRILFVYLLFLLLVPAVAWGQEEGAGDVDPAVEAGRQALDQWSGYPWYDSETDDVRRIQVRQAPQSLNTDWLTPLMWTGIAILLVGLTYFLIRAYLTRERRVAIREDSVRANRRSLVDRVDALPVNLRRDVSDLLGEARRYYEAGDYAEAVIYLYSHMLLTLDRHQFIRLTKGKTNRQYVREIKRAPVRSLLEQTMLVFEDAFFGGHKIARDRFEKCWQALPQFDSLMTQGTG